ncbi:MAG: ATP-binding cassette domain-containing protein [Clostridiales bacterium]|jgi:branched-chain amino acid transport system ATP-binding protein|nr:ATP-binding cassette domain-containing protein [Clostridiales bacterium]
MLLLNIREVSLSINHKRILRDLNLKIQENEIIGLIGPRGSGKTLLCDLLTGFYHSNMGKIIFAGENISNYSQDKINKLGISRSFKESRLFDSISAIENIEIAFHSTINYNFFDIIFKTDNFLDQEKTIKEHSEELFNIFGISDIRNEIVKNISIRLKKKLDIMRGLTSEPRVFILDNPTYGMSRQDSQEIIRLLEMINHKFRTALLIAEEDINVLVNICDRIAVMEHGTILIVGKPAEIKNNQALMSMLIGN